MKTIAMTTTDRSEESISRPLAKTLDQTLSHLPHDIEERLRFARQQALAVQKTEFGTNLVLEPSGTVSLRGGPGHEGLTPWRLLGSVLPLLALLIGLTLIQWWQHEFGVSEIAAIDAALLTDDLPPAAYADTGFMQFLKNPSLASESHD